MRKRYLKTRRKGEQTGEKDRNKRKKRENRESEKNQKGDQR